MRGDEISYRLYQALLIELSEAAIGAARLFDMTIYATNARLITPNGTTIPAMIAV